MNRKTVNGNEAIINRIITEGRERRYEGYVWDDFGKNKRPGPMVPCLWDSDGSVIHPYRKEFDLVEVSK